MSMFNKYIHAADKEGYLVQREDIYGTDGIDGGDTLHRTGLFHFLVEVNKKLGITYDFGIYHTNEMYKKQMGELESGFGTYCRYPKKEYNLEPQHYFNKGPYLGVVSRDQSQPVLLATAAKKDYLRTLRFMLTHSLRLFIFTQKSVKFNSPKENDYKMRYPDITGFEFFALYLRAIPILGYMLYPLVLLGDLETLLGSLNRRYFYGKNDDDVGNHCAICINGMQRVRSPIMWLANKINSYKDMKQKQISYWGGWRQQQFIAEMFDNPMKRYFGE